jgi:hypothetical protein
MQTFKLIDGNYTKEEATEILMNLFSSKINFHELKQFSSIEKYGEANEYTQKRIMELTESRESIRNILSSDSNNIQFRIHSTVNIEILENKND